MSKLKPHSLDIVRRYTEEGDSTYEIAAAYGVTAEGVRLILVNEGVERLSRGALGVPPWAMEKGVACARVANLARSFWTPERDAELLRLGAAGLSQRDLAKALGHSPGAVAARLWRLRRGEVAA